MWNATERSAWFQNRSELELFPAAKWQSGFLKEGTADRAFAGIIPGLNFMVAGNWAAQFELNPFEIGRRRKWKLV